MDALLLHRDETAAAVHRFLRLTPAAAPVSAPPQKERLDSRPPPLLSEDARATARRLFSEHRAHLRKLLRKGGEAANTSAVLLRGFLRSGRGDAREDDHELERDLMPPRALE